MNMNITPEEAAGKIKNGEISVIDVRTPKEYALGHIGGARNINIGDADFENEILKLDKDKSYLVYCHSGGRSSRAQAVMSKLGFADVYNLLGGFSKWGTN